MKTTTIVVSFKQEPNGEVLMQLNIFGKYKYQTKEPNELVGAMHAVGAESIHFRFCDAAGNLQHIVETGAVLGMSDMFAIASRAIGAEAIAAAHVALASMHLHRSPTISTRAQAVAAWAAAERELPPELVFNKAADATSIYRRHADSAD